MAKRYSALELEMFAELVRAQDALWGPIGDFAKTNWQSHPPWELPPWIVPVATTASQTDFDGESQKGCASCAASLCCSMSMASTASQAERMHIAKLSITDDQYKWVFE